MRQSVIKFSSESSPEWLRNSLWCTVSVRSTHLFEHCRVCYGDNRSDQPHVNLDGSSITPGSEHSNAQSDSVESACHLRGRGTVGGNETKFDQGGDTTDPPPVLLRGAAIVMLVFL